MSAQKYFRVVCNKCATEISVPAGVAHTEQQFISKLKEWGWQQMPATALTAPTWTCSDYPYCGEESTGWALSAIREVV